MELFLFARLHARPGKSDAVVPAIRDVQAPTRDEPGCLDYHAFQSVRDSDEYYIHSRWRDQAAFDFHLAQAHTIRFAERLEALIDHPLEPVLTKLPP